MMQPSPELLGLLDNLRSWVAELETEMTQGVFDPDCYELSQKFLADEPKLDTPVNREKLAQTIQDAIEDWLQAALKEKP
jgi:hypothetical protein